MIAITACEAIRRHKRLEIRQDGKTDVVEVHAVGCDKDGHEIALVWEVRERLGEGDDHWALIDLESVNTADILEEKSEAPRPGYVRADSRFAIPIFSV